MVGQYTETVEEVEASIALMRESVRSNRNIQYAFTITTPFPGSQLYDLIFQEGYLRDDKEFYDLYFQSEGVFKYVVNLSDMSDEVLMTMYHKIWNAYKKEKLKVVKPGVMIVEYSMRGVGTVYERLNRKVFSKLRKSSMLNRIGGTGVLDKLNWLYEFVQIRLDHLRLRLRGIPTK
jgi:radical SAM superfamily enzyme YgiQ (UPF0313 family)